MRLLSLVTVMLCAGVSLQADIRITMPDAVKAATSKVQPQYPTAAKLMRVVGDVEVEAVIGTGGDVESVKPVTGNPLLTKAAIEAVEKWKFTPFTADGAASKAVVVLKFQFKP